MAGDRITLINGELVDYEDAKVHVEDRGLQFSESIYEVMYCQGGGIFRRQEHLDRLEESARGIELKMPPIADIDSAVSKVQAAAGLNNGLIYIQVTAGELPRAHAPSQEVPPNFIVIGQDAPAMISSTEPPQITCMSTPDRRWSLCHVKSTGLVVSTMAKKQALAAGFDDAIFVRDGRVTEASASNVFFVSKGELFTAPADNFILHGITRQGVIDVATSLEIPCHEELIPSKLLTDADEAFLSSTSVGLRSISRIDDNLVGSGDPGDITQAIWQGLHELIGKECAEAARETG